MQTPRDESLNREILLWFKCPIFGAWPSLGEMANGTRHTTITRPSRSLRWSKCFRSHNDPTLYTNSTQRHPLHARDRLRSVLSVVAVTSVLILNPPKTHRNRMPKDPKPSTISMFAMRSLKTPRHFNNWSRVFLVRQCRGTRIP